MSHIIIKKKSVKVLLTSKEVNNRESKRNFHLLYNIKDDLEKIG